MLCYRIQPQIIAIMTLFTNLIKRKKILCYLFIAVASRILRGEICNWFWLNRAPKAGGVAYNNERVMSHGGGGWAVLGGVRRNRLQKWKAASLNTGFSSIFDFGGPFKDGSITFTNFQKSTHQLMRGKQKNIILPTLIDVHLFFG